MPRQGETQIVNVTLMCLLIVSLLGSAHSQLKVFTVAGGAARDGGPATSAALTDPHYAAYDRTGNLYIADYFAHRIRRVDKNGSITSIAGNGISGYGGDGGPAKSALVSFPPAVAVDHKGNILIADAGNQRIRMIDRNGIIRTMAGNGIAGYSGDGGPALNASFNGPWCISEDSAGNLYICDQGNNVIRKIDTAGIVTTVAGNGVAGYGGDGGPATLASLNFPYAVIPDGKGGLFISDFNNSVVRHVGRNHIISTFAGTFGGRGCQGDGGPATQATLGGPVGLVLAGNNLIIGADGCARVRSVDLTSNLISTVMGSTTGFDGGGNPPLSSEFFQLSGVLLDPSGNLVVVDHGNARVRELNSNTQIVNTIAGGYTGDGGLGTASALNFQQGIGFDPAGNLYVADTNNHRVRKVTTGGTIATFAGTGISGDTGDGGPASSAELAFPTAVAADHAGNVFIADQNGYVLRKVDSGGTISQLLSFALNATDLATDLAGNLYAADSLECVVWQLTPDNSLSVVAGDGVSFQCGYNGDGIPATQALLNAPSGLWVDTQGNIFIADTFNNLVRRVDHSSGLISTIAGDGNCGFSGDGGPGTSAELCFDLSVTGDEKGNIYIADTGNARVRRINSAHTIQTFAGTGSFAGYNGNGLPAKKTNLDYVYDIAVSPSGVVYWSDSYQCRVRTAH